MKFKIGDLVKIKPCSTIYGIIQDKDSVGIVLKEAVLMFVSDIMDIKTEYWAYDVIINGKTLRNIPEEVLEEFQNENEENFK